MPEIATSSCAMEESPYAEAFKVAAENGFDASEVDIYCPGVDLDNWNRSEIEAQRKRYQGMQKTESLKRINADSSMAMLLGSTLVVVNRSEG